MRILFVTSNRLGDAVLSTGLLDHLVRAHPDALFTVACGPVAEGVFTRLPGLEQIIVVTKQPYGRHWLGLWGAVVGTRWDLVVDLRASILSWLVPTQWRAVLRRRPGHKTQEIAAVLGLDPPPAPVAWTAPEDEAEADRLLPHAPPPRALATGETPTDTVPPDIVPQVDPGHPPLIVLAPTANWAPKVWPGERFAALFRRLAATRFPGAIPVVMGGPGETERAMAAPLLIALPEAIDLVGRLSIPVAAAVLRRAALFVGNDSGLMHLAGSAGAPTIGLFGPTPSAEYAPAGPRTLAVVGPSRAMEAIEVAAVAEAVEHLFARKAPIGPPGIELFPVHPTTG